MVDISYIYIYMCHTIHGVYRYVITGGALQRILTPDPPVSSFCWLPKEGDAPEWTVRVEGAVQVGKFSHPSLGEFWTITIGCDTFGGCDITGFTMFHIDHVH